MGEGNCSRQSGRLLMLGGGVANGVMGVCVSWALFPFTIGSSEKHGQKKIRL
jgi:hypothetical protein